MTTAEFKRQAKAAGLEVQKVWKREVFEISHDGTQIFRVTWAELYPLTDIGPLLAEKLRPEYIPPLG